MQWSGCVCCIHSNKLRSVGCVCCLYLNGEPVFNCGEEVFSLFRSISAYKYFVLLQPKTQTSSRMPCSAVTLSLATITAIVAVALLAIAFSTDNWLYIDVKRAQIHQVSSTVTLPLFTVISLQPLWNIICYWICFYVYTCAYRHIILCAYKI